MTEDQADLLVNARRSIRAARVLVNSGFPGYAASRAYYAMFYIAEAFLEGEGKAFSKHSAVIAAFGRDFAHAGVVPVEFHRYLLTAQEARLNGDYANRPGATERAAREQISHAEEFLELAERLIGPLPAEDE